MLPDHLLNGLIKNFFEVFSHAYHPMSNSDPLMTLYARIFSNLFYLLLTLYFSFRVIGYFFTLLTNLSISGCFCVLLFAFYVFNNYGRAIASNVDTPFHLTKILQRVVSILYRYHLQEQTHQLILINFTPTMGNNINCSCSWSRVRSYRQ